MAAAAPLFGDTVFFVLPVSDTSQLPRRFEVLNALAGAGARCVKRLEAQTDELAPRVVRLVCDPFAKADKDDSQVRAPQRR